MSGESVGEVAAGWEAKSEVRDGIVLVWVRNRALMGWDDM